MRIEASGYSAGAGTSGSSAVRSESCINRSGGWDGRWTTSSSVPPIGLRIAAKRRDVHVGLPLDPGDGGLLDPQRLRDCGLAHARLPAKLAQAFDFLAECLITSLDPLLAFDGETGNDFFDGPAHGFLLQDAQPNEASR